jgi:hypothetical protein
LILYPDEGEAEPSR